VGGLCDLCLGNLNVRACGFPSDLFIFSSPTPLTTNHIPEREYKITKLRIKTEMKRSHYHHYHYWATWDYSLLGESPQEECSSSAGVKSLLVGWKDDGRRRFGKRDGRFRKENRRDEPSLHLFLFRSSSSSCSLVFLFHWDWDCMTKLFLPTWSVHFPFSTWPDQKTEISFRPPLFQLVTTSWGIHRKLFPFLLYSRHLTGEILIQILCFNLIQYY